MNRWQDNVRDFHTQVIGGPISPDVPKLRDAELRARLIAEEAVETIAALVGARAALGILDEFGDKLFEGNEEDGWAQPDLVEAVDGLCDLIYVTLGTAEAIGIDLEPHFDAVHAANMAKTSAKINKHGKRGGKPPGWVSPNEAIANILEDQIDQVRE